LKEILEQQLIVYRRRAVAKALAGRMLCRTKVDYVDTTIGQLTKVRIPCRL